MILKRLILNTVFIIIGILSFSCAEDDINLNDLPINVTPGTIGDTLFIPVTPPIEGLNQPMDIFIGYEPIIYIADYGNNRIVQQSVNFTSYSNFILHPRKITQDRNYDLLVIGSAIDTIPPNILDTVDAVYRLKLQPNGGVIAGVQPIIVFKSNQPTPIPGDHGKLTGISAYQDNYYVLFRSGSNNSSPIDPDNAVFRINKYDNTFPVPERLSGFSLEGQGLLSLLETSGVTTFTYNNRDFIYIQKSQNVSFKIQWAVYDEIEEIYLPKFTPESNVDLLRIGLVNEPQDITIDPLGNIYVIDSFKDSLYKFSSLGKLKSESFGGAGSSLSQFSNPMGVAFFYKTLYICDTGNNRILRFILSTDIN